MDNKKIILALSAVEADKLGLPVLPPLNREDVAELLDEQAFMRHVKSYEVFVASNDMFSEVARYATLFRLIYNVNVVYYPVESIWYDFGLRDLQAEGFEVELKHLEELRLLLKPEDRTADLEASLLRKVAASPELQKLAYTDVDAMFDVHMADAGESNSKDATIAATNGSFDMFNGSSVDGNVRRQTDDYGFNGV